MTKIFFLFIVFITLMAESFAGLPPTSLKGQNGAKATTFNFEVPSQQSTKTSTGGLIETGNPNILANSSFEHSTASTSWLTSVTSTATITLGSAATSTGELGLKQLTFSCAGGASGGVCTIYQDVNTTKVLDGLAGAYISASTTSSTKLKARSNGTTGTDEVVVASTSEAFYQLPIITGSTSTGIVIEITAGISETITGTVDAAILGLFPTRQTVDSSKIAGESYFAGTASCNWLRTSTTVGAFTADTDCPGPTLNTNVISMGSWSTTDSNLPRQTITNLPAGTYKATFIVMANMGAVAAQALAINDGTTTCEPQPGNDSGVAGTGITVSCVFKYTSSGDRNFELYGGSSANGIEVNNNQTTPRRSVKFILEYFGNSSIYSASCGANCGDEFVVAIPTSSGTPVSGSENIDWINGNCVRSGTNGGVIDCPIISGIFSQLPVCTATTSVAGGRTQFIRASSTTTSLQFATYDTAEGLSGAGIEISCSKTGSNFTASRTIVGSFKEVVTAPGVTKPKTCWVTWGTCASTPCTLILNRGGCASSVSRASAGNYTVNFNTSTFSEAPACSWVSAGERSFVGSLPSTTSFNVLSRDSAGVQTDSAANMIICTGSAP